MTVTESRPAVEAFMAAQPELIHIGCNKEPKLALCGDWDDSPEPVTEDATCVVCNDLELNQPDYCPMGGRCDCT